MMERRFIKSGIPGLDEVLGGGILEGSVVTVSGPTGAGKSTFAAQFLYSGAKDSGEPGIYIAIEESRKDFFFHMSGYEWDFASLEQDRRFILLDYPLHEVDQIINQSNAIHEIISTTGVKRVVIDSIMPVALFFKSDDERKMGFLKFIENLRKWGVTVLIVSEDLKIHSGARPSSEYGIESFADGWINLFFKYDDKRMERVRCIEVVKMKGVAHSARAYPVTLGNKGFRVEREELKPLLEDKPARAREKHAPAAQKKDAPASEQEEARVEEGKARPPPPARPQARRIAQPPGKTPAAPQKGEAKGQRAAPVKMTPTLAARLAEAKKKIMKK